MYVDYQCGSRFTEFDEAHRRAPSRIRQANQRSDEISSAARHVDGKAHTGESLLHLSVHATLGNTCKLEVKSLSADANLK